MIRKTLSLTLALLFSCTLLVTTGCGEAEPPPSTSTVPKKPRSMTIPQPDGKPKDAGGAAAPNP